MLDLLASILKFCCISSSEWAFSGSQQRLETYMDLMSRVQKINQNLFSTNDANTSYALDVAELYRLAALIYLLRCHEDIVDNSEDLSSYVASAFDVLSRLRVCERPFPLLITGCEAKTDKGRHIVLALISNTISETKVRSYNCVRAVTESFWNLEDLDDGDKTPYISKMTTVISCSDIFPSFI
jgi:hypothetical protein